MALMFHFNTYKTMGYDKKVCCICKNVFYGWGNNPWPINDGLNGEECCSLCNQALVIPARIKLAYNKK